MAILSTWAVSQQMPVVAVKYKGGEVIQNYAVQSAVGDYVFNSSSSPDEYGIVWVQPFPGNLAGVACRIAFGGLANDCDIVLYNSRNVAIASASLLGDFASANPSLKKYMYYPLHETRLREGETYRLTFKPTTTNNITISDLDFVDTGSRLAAFGFGYLTSRVDGGSWTDNTLKAVELTPIIGSINPRRY